MKRILIVIFLFFVLIVFVLPLLEKWADWIEMPTYRNDIENQFEGSVTGKHHYRGEYINLADSLGQEFEIYSASLALYDSAKVGDRIEKLPDSNKCILRRGDRSYRLNCYYIREGIRARFDPPIAEWPE